MWNLQLTVGGVSQRRKGRKGECAWYREDMERIGAWQASRHSEQAGKQAFRADMGRHSVLRTSYLRRVCRSYGACVAISMKWIADTEYKTI